MPTCIQIEDADDAYMAERLMFEPIDGRHARVEIIDGEETVVFPRRALHVDEIRGGVIVDPAVNERCHREMAARTEATRRTSRQIGEVFHDAEGIPQNDPAIRRQVTEQMADLPLLLRDTSRRLCETRDTITASELIGPDDVAVVLDESELIRDGMTAVEREDLFQQEAEDCPLALHYLREYRYGGNPDDDMGRAEEEEKRDPAASKTVRVIPAPNTVNASPESFFRSDGVARVEMDADYFVMCALQLGEMTPDVDGFLWASGFDLNAFMDANEYDDVPNDRVTRTLGTCQALRRRFLQWRPRATDIERAYCGLGLVYNTRSALDDLPTTISDRAVVELLKRENPNRPLEEAVFDPEFLQEVIEHREAFGLWTRDIGESWRLAEEAFATADKQELLRYTQGMIQVRNLRFAACPREEEYGPAVIPQRPLKKLAREVRRKSKRARSALNRSMKLFSDMIGREELRTFMGGDNLVIEGKFFNFRIRRGYIGILEHTRNPEAAHTPFQLDVMDKHGRELCSACTFYRGTPVLDQVVALYLHVTSMDEEYVLGHANLYNRSEAFYDNADIQRIVGERYARPAPRNVEAAEGDAVPVFADPAMQLFGIPNDRFRQEVIPWRNRTRQRILEVLADMAGISHEVMSMLAAVKQSQDEFVHMNAITARSLTDLLRQST